MPGQLPVSLKPVGDIELFPAVLIECLADHGCDGSQSLFTLTGIARWGHSFNVMAGLVPIGIRLSAPPGRIWHDALRFPRHGRT